LKKPVIVVIAVLLADFITKHLIRANLAVYEAIVVTPFLQIVHVQNRGAAFGIFSSLGNKFFIAVAAIAIVGVIIYMMKVKEHRIIMALILGGAAGNLFDRIHQGYVTDFVDFHIGDLHWPAFNVADSALSLSIFLLIISILRDGKAKAPSEEGQHPPG